jgi:hypothetical protein
MAEENYRFSLTKILREDTQRKDLAEGVAERKDLRDVFQEVEQKFVQLPFLTVRTVQDGRIDVPMDDKCIHTYHRPA